MWELFGYNDQLTCLLSIIKLKCPEKPLISHQDWNEILLRSIHITSISGLFAGLQHTRAIMIKTSLHLKWCFQIFWTLTLKLLHWALLWTISQKGSYSYYLYLQMKLRTVNDSLRLVSSGVKREKYLALNMCVTITVENT